MTSLEMRARRVVRRLDNAGFSATAAILNWWTRPRPSLRGIVVGMRWACIILASCIAVELIAFLTLGRRP